MLVVYLLLLSLLHLSSSACGAVDVEGAAACSRWNRRLLPADVPYSSSSPAAAVALRRDNHVAMALQYMKSTSSGEHVRMTARRLLGCRPSPVEARDAVEGGNGMPRAAVVMAPSPRGGYVHGGHKEAAAGGGEAGNQSSPELIMTGDGTERNGDVGVDYPAPKTHPPSHN